MVIVLVVILVLGLWLMMTFNGLIKLRNDVKNAFAQIDVQLKRRHDLIPNLVNSVKGEMKFEKETLENVIKARNSAVAVSGSGNVGDISKKEGELTMALGRLFALSENYPNLKAIDTVKTLMEELTHTESNISFARQLYNDLVTKFNTKQQVFPTNMIASMLGFSAEQLFELPKDSAEKDVPKVDL